MICGCALGAAPRCSPSPGWIRAAGVLDRPAADRLLCLVDAQIRLCATRGVPLGHVVVDLANLTRFEPEGLEALHDRWNESGDRGVRLHLAGCGGRIFLLPARVGRLIGRFSMFPSAEVALAQLSGPAVDVPAPRSPADLTASPEPAAAAPRP